LIVAAEGEWSKANTKPRTKGRAMFQGPNRNRDIMVAVGAVVIVALIVWYAMS
jgi:hypothetical protein